MRFIDERGRICGILNLVDALVIVLAAAVLFFAVPRLARTTGGGGGEGMPLRFTVLVDKVTPEAFAAATQNIPAQLMASGFLADGYVVAAEAGPHMVYTLDTLGRTVCVEDDRLLDVVFTVEATVPRQEVLLNTVGTQEIRIGRAHYLKTERFEFVGPISTAEWPDL